MVWANYSTYKYILSTESFGCSALRSVDKFAVFWVRVAFVKYVRTDVDDDGGESDEQ